MTAYQQKMATVGRARKTPDEMALLVQCKDDVVADNMFCITHGADKFLVKPAPYFRKIEVPEPLPEKPKTDWEEYLGWGDRWIAEKVGWAKVPPKIRGMIYIIVVCIFIVPPVTSTDLEPMGRIVLFAIGIAILFSVRGWEKKQDHSIFEAGEKSTPKPTGLDVLTIENYLKSGDEINALKAYRSQTGSNLEEAKIAIKQLKAKL